MMPTVHVRLPALLQIVQLLRHLSSTLHSSVQTDFQLVYCPLQVVTGQGKHSLQGKARILPAVIRYLSEAGWPYRMEPQNPGVLLVNIGGQKRF